jgi:cysteine desulfurase/selenocysteine lyase
MPTPTPTKADLARGADLPDEAALASMANLFFRALPGQEIDPSRHDAPDSLVLQLDDSDPSVHAPAGFPEGVDPQQAASHPAQPGSVTGGSRGIPSSIPAAYAPALPQLDSPPPLAPTSPYYFVGEAGAYPSRPPQPSDVVDRVTVPSYHLPGAGDLQDMLGQISTGYPRESAHEDSRAGEEHNRFYFLTSPDSELQVRSRTAHGSGAPFDVHAVRRDFPILSERVHGRQLVWLDNAATTQKPQAVIDRLAWFYAHENSNIHRAAHDLAARATDAYEGARQKVARFLGAASPEEIIFVRGATEAINLVANSFGSTFINEGDEIIVSHLEHHANIVPWQMIAAEKGAKIRVIPVDDSGQILLDAYRKLLSERTKIVSVTQVSNALGTITPVKAIVDLAHQAGAFALIDGAQAVSHLRVNMQALDCDFYVFSGHKVFAPTGIGVVYGKKAVLDRLLPYQGGGNMIADVTFERTVYQKPPARFEAGTGNIADAVGLGAALDYLEQLGLENVARYEHDLLVYAIHGMQTVPGLHLIGTAQEKTSVLSFVLDGYRTEEVGKALNEEGIAVRAGHHCAQPILRRFGLETTVRPSLALYNTCDEIDHLIRVLHRLAGRRS